MTDHPIIFSAAMVQALLAGRKTQTRRLASSPLRRCVVGDRLWVREEWKSTPAYDDLKPVEMGGEEPLYYPADGATFNWAEADGHLFGRRRPGMHMPRWASRLTLIVEAVDIEPLQLIDHDDAIAEGIERIEDPRGVAWKSYETCRDGTPHPHASVPNRSPITSYREVWDSLHRKEGVRWDDNPEVLVLTFRVERENIDQLERGA